MNIITELRLPPYSATLKELGEVAGVSDLQRFQLEFVSKYLHCVALEHKIRQE